MGKAFLLYTPAFVFALLFAASMTAAGGAHLIHVSQQVDPFAPYEALIPGQPADILAAYPCHYQESPESGIEPTLCRLYPEDGFFSEIIIVFDDSILQVVMKAEDLRVGDLVERWGRPQARVNGRGDFYLWWSSSTSALALSGGAHDGLNYFMPVDTMTWRLVDVERYHRSPLAR